MGKTLQEFLDRHAGIVELAKGARVAGFLRRVPGGLRILDLSLTPAPEGSMCESLGFRLEESGLVAVDEWMERSDLLCVLKSLRSGHIMLSPSLESAGLGELTDWNEQTVDRPYAWHNERLEWPLHIARTCSRELNGQGLGPVTERWRVRLPFLKPAFRDMTALCCTLGVRNTPYDRHDAQFRLYLPIPARIERAKHEPGCLRLRVEVRNHGLAPDRVQLSIVARNGGAHAGCHLTGFELVSGMDGMWRGTVEWDRAGLADVFLAVDGEVVDRVEVGAPDLLGRAYECVDESLEKLLMDLRLSPTTSKKKRAADRFELAVTTLFGLLGCPSVHIGEGGDLSAADVLVRAPDGRLLLIECSTQAIGQDKFTKLEARARELEVRLRGSSGPVRIVPLAVQAVPAGEGKLKGLLDSFDVKSLVDRVRMGLGFEGVPSGG